MNMSARMRTWRRALLVVAGGGLLAQQGCVIDPDLILNAATQFFTELAIFVTDNALTSLR